jgi:hypothetical protein
MSMMQKMMLERDAQSIINYSQAVVYSILSIMFG